MDLSLTDEQIALQQMVRAFVDKDIAPYATEWDRAESVDLAIIGKLGDLGLLGLTIPEQHGGSGGDTLAYCLALEELGRGDSSVRGIVSVSLGLVTKSIVGSGTPEQIERWVPGLCAGQMVGSFALTESGSGSDPASLSIRATRDGAGWRVSGTKMFITNGTWASVVLLFARTGGEGSRGITAFLVPTDVEGLSRSTIHGKLGLRGQATAELVFDDVYLPEEWRLGEEGRGLSIAMAALAKGRMSVAAGCVGLARGALEHALRYAGQREQFGKPIAGHQLVQELLADMAVEVDAARLLTWRVADLIDRHLPFATESSMAKLFASEVAVKASASALQVFGGYGFIDEYPVGKLTRDARVMTLYEGTSQIQKLVIGRALTGINAFG